MSGAGATKPTVIVVGGGLAGLAAAAALADSGCDVELHESRKKLGGRAASFRDPATGESVDHCQHVGMACCTNLGDFCRRTGIAALFRRDRTLHFFAADGRRHDVRAGLLPAPLHLLPSLLRLGYLSLSERLGICRAMWKLARADVADDRETVGAWLVQHGQTERAIERFWGPVLVSALGETVERASLKYAKKVFVEGFLMNRSGYEIDVPTVSLGELYGARLEHHFAERGVRIRLDSPARSIRADDGRRCAVELADGSVLRPDAVVAAVTWRRAAELLAPELRARIPGGEHWASFDSAPISGVHLWFDRELTDLPHAVLVGTLAQWLFRRESRSAERGTRSDEFYYQVVISASYDLAAMEKSAIVERVTTELRAVFPAARDAILLRSKVVTEQEAVFSVRPGLDAWRPTQTTPVPGLFLAGDWTATGWPATMEGAVRSGYLAAQGVLESLDRPQRALIADLPPCRLARRLIEI
jgi:squalene-associated FAD-dependent desaturase